MTRPPRPVPASLRGSTFSSAAICRADGDSSGSTAAAAVVTGIALSSTTAGAGFAAASFGFAGAPAPSSMRPTTAPMATFWPSFVPIFRTPEVGADTSVEALSVSNSYSGSPSRTASPSAFSQREDALGDRLSDRRDFDVNSHRNWG